MKTRKLALGNQNIVGQALMAIRKEKGMKTKDAVRLLNEHGAKLNQSALSKIEGCHQPIKDTQLLAFSVAYDVSIDKIFDMALSNMDSDDPK